MTEIILALDFENRERARAFLNRVGDGLKWVKIGLQMFIHYGPDWVKEVTDMGYSVFLDLKLHDIPNQVAGAIRSLSKMPIGMMTLHTCGGKEMMEWAKRAQEEACPNVLLLGVTVLTSMDASGLQYIGIQEKPIDRVLRLGTLARDAGLKGLVCSPQEGLLLKEKLGREIVCVTPGIRLKEDASDDQKRVMTPSEAASAGIDYLVIGRPILKADDPREKIARIRNEIKVPYLADPV